MSHLFEENCLSGLRLKNRIIRSATYEGLGYEDGRPMEQLTELYIRLAKGGAGAIITGYAAVQKNGRTLKNMLLFDDNACLEGYRRMTARVKEHGSPLILQIAHGGGQSLPELGPVAPTKRRYPLNMHVARELSDVEIRGMIESFVAAIVRAREAGFDGIQLHAGHGYLLSSFLLPNLNKRTDQWGGSLENRFRIIDEIITTARERVGNYPILMKLSAHGPEAAEIAKMFEKAGGSAIEVSCGNLEDGLSTVRMRKVPTNAVLTLVPALRSASFPKRVFFRLAAPFIYKMPQPLHNYNVEAAARIKQAVDIPVIVVGGIRRRDGMENILARGQADYVSMSRPFIIEPDFARRIQEEQQSESRCIDCGYCLMGVLGRPVRCYYGKTA